MSDQLSSDLAALRISRDEPTSSGRGRLLLVLLVLVAGVAAAWVYGVPYLEAKVFKVEVETTQVTIVSPSQADVQLTSTGYVVPQRVSKVGARIAGRIARVHIAEGDRVEVGQLLAELEAADREAALETARSQVSLAKAQVATAKAELADAQQRAERERKLAARGVAPAAEADDLEARVVALRSTVAAAQASVKAAQTQVDALSVDLGDLRITAPIAGTIVSKPTTEGELVGQMAASIVEIADFSSLVVETDVPEARLHLVEIGRPAEIVLDAFPGDRYRGRVREYSPRVDRAKATVTVKVEFVDATDRVLPDMSARVSFLTKELEADQMQEPAKVVVPATALTERSGAKVVFVLDAGVVKMKGVTLGESLGGGFELLDGPAPGTKLVRAPPPELQDGQEVKVKEAT